MDVDDDEGSNLGAKDSEEAEDDVHHSEVDSESFARGAEQARDALQDDGMLPDAFQKPIRVRLIQRASSPPKVPAPKAPSKATAKAPSKATAKAMFTPYEMVPAKGALAPPDKSKVAKEAKAPSKRGSSGKVVLRPAKGAKTV